MGLPEGTRSSRSVGPSSARRRWRRLVARRCHRPLAKRLKNKGAAVGQRGGRGAERSVEIEQRAPSYSLTPTETPQKIWGFGQERQRQNSSYKIACGGRWPHKRTSGAHAARHNVNFQRRHFDRGPDGDEHDEKGIFGPASAERLERFRVESATRTGHRQAVVYAVQHTV